MNARRGWVIVLGLLVIVASVAFLLQRRMAGVLQDERALLREENRELARLRAENQRLAAAQVSDAELQRLRSDHAALARLRSEVDALRERTEQMARQNAEAASASVHARPTVSSALPALALNLGIGADGGLSLEGGPVDLGVLRQRLLAVPKGERVDVRLRMPADQRIDGMDALQRNIDGIMSLAKELGLKMTLQMERSPK